MNIRIRNTQKKRRLAFQRIRKQLSSLLAISAHPGAELSVWFAGNAAVRSLNRRYRGKDTTTDVLSFSFREGAFADLQTDMLGDIVICVPVAERQAREAGHSLEHELEMLLVHGLLHLLGYDHEQGPGEERRMKRREAMLLKRISR